MHEWKEGDLGVAREGAPHFAPPGTVVRLAEKINPDLGYWDVVFGPIPSESIWQVTVLGHDTGLRAASMRFIEPLPEGDE